MLVLEWWSSIRLARYPSGRYSGPSVVWSIPAQNEGIALDAVVVVEVVGLFVVVGATVGFEPTGFAGGRIVTMRGTSGSLGD